MPLVMILVAAVALATLIAPSQASAGSATATGGDYSVYLSFEAAPGERNLLTVRHDNMAWTLRDAAAPLSAGAGCVQVREHEIRCATPRWYSPGGDEAYEPDVRITTGDGDDVVDFAANLPGYWRLWLDGGAGNDGIATHAKTRTVNIVGGPGDDSLRGGPGSDVIHGGEGSDELHGGRGGDWLYGDDGALSEETPIVANDVIDGGSGADTVEFESKTRVNVDLADPAPDGGAGEADRLQRIENVRATSSRRIVLRGDGGPNELGVADTYPDDDRRHRRHALVGRGGDDLLYGGPASQLDGGRGDDRLWAIVRTSRIRCGPGDDAVNPLAYAVVGQDVPSPVPRACEWIASDAGVDASNAPMVLRDGRVHLPLRRLQARGQLDLKVTLHAPRASRPLARGRVVLGAGRAGVRTVFIRLTAAGRRALDRRTTVVVRLAAPFSGAFAIRYRAVVLDPT